MKKIIYITIALFTFISFSYSENYPPTAIAVIDINQILTESKAAKKASKEIEKISMKIEEEVKVSDEEMLSSQQELIEQQSIMSPEAFENKAKDFDKKAQNYQIKRQEKLVKLDELVQNSRNLILDALKPILEKISLEKGITVILEKNNTILSADDMDITDEIIKALNKELPKIEISLD